MIGNGLGERLRLCAALLVAAAVTIGQPRTALRKVSKAMRLWYSGFERDGFVEIELAKSRLAVCEQCPLFYRPLRTCGSPLKKSLRSLGCYCNMWAKSKLKDATCWIDDNLPRPNAYGWAACGIPAASQDNPPPAALNGSAADA